MQAWPTQLDSLVDAHFDHMVEVRRHLHRHPEPSGEEFATSLYLQHQAELGGLMATLTPQKRGLVVEEPAGAPGPRIALRADIDALRVQEQSAVQYRSCHDGIMHACGHDGHAATVLGACLALHDAAVHGLLPWPVAWRGIFQPAEETAAGALEMIAAGALEGVEAILAAHLDPSRQAGRVGIRFGALTAATDSIRILIHGRGGHAARPHESLDPIAAAAQLITNLYLFVPRATDSHQPVVVTIGQIEAGHNPNVIPECAALRGTLRTLGGVSREQSKSYIQQLARGVAEASRTRIEVEFEQGPDSVVNDVTLTTLLQDAAQNLLGASNVDLITRTSMGGEDFSFYLANVPGAMFRLGCAGAAAGGAPLHAPDFDIDERALAVGAKLLARAVVQWSDPLQRNRTIPSAEGGHEQTEL